MGQGGDELALGSAPAALLGGERVVRTIRTELVADAGLVGHVADGEAGGRPLDHRLAVTVGLVEDLGMLGFFG